jgi:hypothetical protein
MGILSILDNTVTMMKTDKNCLSDIKQAHQAVKRYRK